jgi:fructokinase
LCGDRNGTVPQVPPGGLIVVAGEALIDLVPAPGDTLAAHLGGGPFNTARALGRLDRPVAYLGRLSTDRFGARLAGQLAADGVRLDAHVRTDDPTTLALVELDERGSAAYRFYVDGTAAPGLTPADALAALPAGVGFLHIGTLGLVLEPAADALEALAGELHGRALVMADPNCRPAVIAAPAAYRARLTRVLALADVVKVSEEDLAWLAPGVPARDAARALLGQGPAVVLLTRGGEGAVALTAEGAAEVPAPPVRVVDTIGAGDAFSAGWLAWWSEHGLDRAALADGEAVAEATRFACLVAARTCERAGASPPRRAEL